MVSVFPVFKKTTVFMSEVETLQVGKGGSCSRDPTVTGQGLEGGHRG